MSAYEDLQQAVRKLCIKCLSEYFPTQADQDELIYFSHDNGPEPDRPYVVINILGMDQKGHAVRSSLLQSDNATFTTQASYEATVQFGFCGTSAGTLAQEFTQRINNSVLVIDSYRTTKLGVMRKTNVRRIPQKRDTQWIEYFNIDVVFSYVLLTKETVDYIEAVVVEDVYRDNLFRVPEGPIPPI